jgi:hypothetical protein
MSNTDAVGIARLAQFRQPTEDEIQQQITRTMGDVVRHDARHNPNGFRHPGEGNTRPAGAVPTVGLPNAPGETNGIPNNWGWQAPTPLDVPGGQSAQDAIARMCDAALGPVCGARPEPTGGKR